VVVLRLINLFTVSVEFVALFTAGFENVSFSVRK